MKQTILSVILSFSLAVMTPGAVEIAKAETVPSEKQATVSLENGSYEEGSVIVTLASPDETPLTKEGTTSFDKHIRVEDSYDFGDASVLGATKKSRQFFSDKTFTVSQVTSDEYSTEELMDRLEDNAYVVNVEPDYHMYKMGSTNDTLSDAQWDLDGGGLFSGSTKGIQYSKASQTTAADTPVVAVVDTGVDYTHEDLASKMWRNPYTSVLPGTYGYDFGDNDSDPMDTDEDSHGTHCAGTIGAAANNSKGIAGVAGSVKIMALKIFDSKESANLSYIISAFNYIYMAQQLGVNITAVNCSWGGSPSSSTLQALVNKIGSAGALFVFASGNDGIDHDDVMQQNVCPYDLYSPYAVVVGASTTSDTKANFSDYGRSTVDLFAPGQKIVSSVAADTFFPALYSSQKQKEITTYTNNCDADDALLVTSEYIGKRDTQIYDVSVSHSSFDYFDQTGSGSTKVSFQASSHGRSALHLYLDVTDLDLSSDASYYLAYDLGVEKGDSLSWEHTFLKRNGSSIITYNGRKYLSVVNLEGTLSSYSNLYFDNLAISKANPATSTFGKYNCYSGTSMAAPVVSGAIAILAGAVSSDSAITRRQRLMQCVRTTQALSSVCKTGGILDLSKLSTVTASTTSSKNSGTTSRAGSTSSTTKKVLVKKVKLNKKKATLKYKKTLKLKATVTPKNATNKKVKWYVSNKKYATVSSKGVVKAKKKGIGHTVRVYAKAKDRSKKKASCKVKIKKK